MKCFCCIKSFHSAMASRNQPAHRCLINWNSAPQWTGMRRFMPFSLVHLIYRTFLFVILLDYLYRAGNTCCSPIASKITRFGDSQNGENDQFVCCCCYSAIVGCCPSNRLIVARVIARWHSRHDPIHGPANYRPVVNLTLTNIQFVHLFICSFFFHEERK